MTEKENPKTKKTIGELAVGEIITVDVPCQVRVLFIREVDGSGYSGNRQVFWQVVKPVESVGVERVGSKVDVHVWERT